MVRSAENFSKISNQEDDGSSQPMSMVSVKTTQSKERKKNYLYRKSCTKPPRNCPWWMITTMKTPKQSSSWVLPSPFVFFFVPHHLRLVHFQLKVSPPKNNNNNNNQTSLVIGKLFRICCCFKSDKCGLWSFGHKRGDHS